jgi:hypothetical protein
LKSIDIFLEFAIFILGAQGVHLFSEPHETAVWKRFKSHKTAREHNWPDFFSAAGMLILEFLNPIPCSGFDGIYESKGADLLGVGLLRDNRGFTSFTYLCGWRGTFGKLISILKLTFLTCYPLSSHISHILSNPLQM